MTWTEEMRRKYPLTFAHGFYQEFQDGWRPLIDKLAAELEPIIAQLPEDPDFGRPYCVQCKEKFGGLRFYMSCYNGLIEDVISLTEKLARMTCEKCGSRGDDVKTLKGSRGWVGTYCDKCRS